MRVILIKIRIAQSICRGWLFSRINCVSRIAAIDKGFSFRYLGKVEFGKNVKLGQNVIIKGFNKESLLIIDDNVYIGDNVIIECNKFVRIGCDCLLAPGVYVTDSAHNYSNAEVAIRSQGGSYEDVQIQNNCWIGTGTVILKGSEICKDSVVGALSLVNKKGLKGLIYGVPARSH